MKFFLFWNVVTHLIYPADRSNSCRAPLPADKRSYRVALTDQGRAEIERVRRAHICADLEFVQAFSDAEVCQLAALMQKAKTFYQQSQKPEGSL